MRSREMRSGLRDRGEMGKREDCGRERSRGRRSSLQDLERSRKMRDRGRTGGGDSEWSLKIRKRVRGEG